MSTLIIIGRIILGLFFLMSGLRHFTSYHNMKKYSQSLRIPFPGLGVVVTGIAMLFGAVGLIFWQGLSSGWLLASLVSLVVFLVLASFLAHAFWRMPAAGRVEQMRYFTANMALAGGILMIMGLIG